MNAKVIGIGAAGNKAAICLIEKEIVLRKDVLLLNSTLKDIPKDYLDISKRFTDDIEGCGKQRDLAKEITLESIKNNTLLLDGLLDPQDDTVIIVNSSEGGTGCGASIVIAKYFKQVLNVNVHTFVFTGFEDDGRGLQNTIEYFQEISGDYTVEAISNKKFLKDVSTRQKAEQLANLEFAKHIKILLGQIIVDSDQNIDTMDLYKVSTNPGYMIIDYVALENIKNVEAYNKTIINMLDNCKSLDISKPSCSKLGVIFNVSDKIRDYVDFSSAVIKERLGYPYEYFHQIQSEGNKDYVAFIASGMNMPLDEVKEIYNSYIESSSKVNKDKDDFFNAISELKGFSEDSMFDVVPRTIIAPTNDSKKAFFNDFGLDAPLDPKFKNVKNNEDIKNNY